MASPEKIMSQQFMAFEKTIEKILGEPIADIRNRPLDEQRRLIENKHKKPMKFETRFPFIGRGNILRDRTVDNETVEKLLDEALKA